MTSELPESSSDQWTLDGSNLESETATQTATKAEPAGDAADAADAAAEESQPASTRSRSRRSKTLYFDLETIPDESRAELFGLPDLAAPAPRAELSACPAAEEVLGKPIPDIEKLIADLRPPDEWLVSLRQAEEGRGKRKGLFGLISDALSESDRLLSASAERQKLLSTTPEFCSICAFGFAVGDEPAQSMVVGLDDITEADLLDAFWKLVAECKPVVGFNIIGFDVPVIMVRSMILGVPPSRRIDLTPWKGDVLDLYIARFGNRGNTSKDRPGKLKELCRLLGIPIPAEDVDGGQVQELYRTDPEKVGVYAESDVTLVQALHRKYAGLFC